MAGTRVRRLLIAFGNSSDFAFQGGRHEPARIADRRVRERFAREWTDAWKVHDIARVMTHNAEDFQQRDVKRWRRITEL
jgi:hypothetical protein